jgi:hypothetical protein
MKKVLAILLFVAICLLLLGIVANSILAINPWQHIDGDEFGLINWNGFMGLAGLISAAFITKTIIRNRPRDQFPLSFFYCGWQNSAYDGVVRDRAGYYQA